MRDAPKDDILENMFKTKPTYSEQLKTITALYNQDAAQENEPTRYTRLKNMVKRYLNQVTKDRNINASNAIRRKADDRRDSEEGKPGDCRQRLANGMCSTGGSCSFKHDIGKKDKGKGKRDRRSSPSLEQRSQSKDSKYGKRASEGKVPKGTSPS